MRYLKIILIVLLVQITNTFAYSDGKIAFIDMQFIMDKSLAGQSLKKQLENLHKKNLDSFKKKEETLKKKEQEILSKKIFYLKKNLKRKPQI